MSADANRDWRIEPSPLGTDWSSVGYNWDGEPVDRRGEFVPIHHWARRSSAEAMIAALQTGATRSAAIAAGRAA